MSDKIKVQIFGVKYKEISSGCGCSNKKSGCDSCKSKKESCDGCGSSGGCGKNSGNTVGQAYDKLKKFIEESDVNNKTELEFIDLDQINIKEKYPKIKETIDKGFEPPITVIDDIIRYYGGISESLVYKDIKELLE